MKRVEMSAAGLTLLLHRAESALSLWEIVWSNTGEPPTAHYRDLAEASREARGRLGLPPREPWKPRPPREPVAPARPSVDLQALRTECKRTIEQAVAIENRYRDGPITDPADAAEVERLCKEAAAMEERIEETEERLNRRRRMLSEPTPCTSPTINRPVRERILFTPREEGG